jgi:metal-responsive CopG/Arc/MetJ family transcriptional regulator
MWPMAASRIVVALSDEWLARVDQSCARSGWTRAEVIAAAVERFADAQPDEAVDRALVDGYTRKPATDTSAGEAARQLIAAERW